MKVNLVTSDGKRNPPIGEYGSLTAYGHALKTMALHSLILKMKLPHRHEQSKKHLSEISKAYGDIALKQALNLRKIRDKRKRK